MEAPDIYLPARRRQLEVGIDVVVSGLKLAVAGNVEKSSLLPKFLSVCMIAAFQPTFDGSAMQQL